ncbi:hypothetical protein BHM03_00016517 [Ensete ventricosum]|nr:hypothetical protein BHM03_00016517 [Ensete ventricosum]
MRTSEPFLQPGRAWMVLEIHRRRGSLVHPDSKSHARGLHSTTDRRHDPSTDPVGRASRPPSSAVIYLPTPPPSFPFLLPRNESSHLPEIKMLTPLGHGFAPDNFGPPWANKPAEAPEPDNQTAVSPEELRRLHRMISNRQSARRCRMRRQRHVEELRARASTLRSENRGLADRLAGLAHRCLLVRLDNHRLRAEASVLRRRLADLRLHHHYYYHHHKQVSYSGGYFLGSN